MPRLSRPASRLPFQPIPSWPLPANAIQKTFRYLQKRDYVRRGGCAVSATGQKTKMCDAKTCDANTRDSHNAAELFINSVPSILIGIDDQGHIKRWNRAAAQTFGLEETDVRGKRLSQLRNPLAELGN